MDDQRRSEEAEAQQARVPARGGRRRVLAAIKALGLPERYAISDLIELASRRTGRPLHVQAWAMPRRSPSGLWAATARADYIFFDETLGPEQRDVVLLHELTHLFLNHRPDEVIDEAPIIAQLVPTVSTANIDLILGRARHHYDSPIEAFTEQVARRLALRLTRGEDMAPPDPIAQHIARTLLPRDGPR